MKAMIFAAGLGTRLRPHTNLIPKVCLPFLNVPIVGYSLKLLEQMGVTELVANTHHLPEQVESVMSQRSRLPLSFSHESPQILNGGGGLFHARAHFKSEENFVVANGDELLFVESDKEMPKFWETHKQNGGICTLLVCDHPRIGKGLSCVWANAKGEIAGFGPQPPSQGLKGYHFTGYFVFSNQMLDFLVPDPTNILHDNLMQAIRRGKKVYVHALDRCLWFESGNESEYLAASRKALEILNPKRLLEEHNAESLSKLRTQILATLNRFDVFPDMKHLEESRLISPAAVLKSKSGGTSPMQEINPAEIYKNQKGFLVIDAGSGIESGCATENAVIVNRQFGRASDHLAGLVTGAS